MSPEQIEALSKLLILLSALNALVTLGTLFLLARVRAVWELVAEWRQDRRSARELVSE